MTPPYRLISPCRLYRLFYRWISAPFSRAFAGRRNGTGSHRLLYRRLLRNSMRNRKTCVCADPKLKSLAGARICGKTAVTLMGRRCPGSGLIRTVSLYNPSLNNKVSQSPSSNLSHRSTSSQSVERQQKHTSQGTISASPERDPRSKPEKRSFDIFRTSNVGLVKLRKPHVLNREKERDSKRFKNASEPQYLRSGMVLLKNFINHADQVKVLNKCRELGIGSGGFYRPGYRSGKKLHLQMMCLGKDWDPDSKLYKDSRFFDDSVPPEIPREFKKLVDGALHTAHNFLRQNSISVEEIPNMSPDVCIVNFYENRGKLGLHKDKDESRESIAKGLPVVSFSVGDSAEFLYGDVWYANKAEKVILDSGDVLIFGGKSRLIFHGVASIIPNTAPKFLTKETAVRPGRLNLTFRQL